MSVLEEHDAKVLEAAAKLKAAIGAAALANTAWIKAAEEQDRTSKDRDRTATLVQKAKDALLQAAGVPIEKKTQS